MWKEEHYSAMPEDDQQQDDQKKQQKRNQPYDSSMKGLVEQQAPQMLTYMVEGAIYQETLDIEIIRPTMRADRVYRILYQGQPHILHLEFQTSKDDDLPIRLLVDCSVLYQQYRLPIISVVVYPFKTTIAKSPLRVMSGKKEIIKLNFRILLLYKEDATKYVESHAISMYPLLPAMKQVDASLIRRACEEMKTFYQGQDAVFRDQIVWTKVFLDGNKTLTLEERQKIEEVLVMYGLDRLWEENPRVQQTFAAGEAKGKAEGKAEGQLEGLRSSVERVVNIRFPSLTELAHRKVASIMQPEALNILLEQFVAAPNEEAARRLLLPQEPS
jgi:predicted transposase YdaD